MTRTTRRILAAGICGLTLLGTGLAAAAETGPIREVYACNFKGNSDVGDLMSARDYYLQQLEKADLEPSDAFVWTPIAGAPDVDFLWFNNAENLNEFGRASDAYYATEEGRAADSRFESVADCTMSLSTRQLVYDGGALEVEDNSAIIGAAACRLRHGQNMANVQDLITHLRGVLEASDMHDAFLAYIEVPMVSSTDMDLYFYGVHDSMTDYAARTTMVQTADSWGMLRRHFEQVVDCNSSLWNGMQVVPAP